MIDATNATEAITPGDLRKARYFTQAELAARLDISQPGLAALEGRPDPQLSSLRRYVRALGGELEVRAVFPDAVYVLQSPKQKVRRH